MKLCTIYCGGCNPRYDRAGMMDKIEKKYDDIEIVYYDKDEDCDLVIILSGCKSPCVKHNDALGRYGKIIVDDANHYDRIVDSIEKINKKKIS